MADLYAARERCEIAKVCLSLILSLFLFGSVVSFGQTVNSSAGQAYLTSACRNEDEKEPCNTNALQQDLGSRYDDLRSSDTVAKNGSWYYN